MNKRGISLFIVGAVLILLSFSLACYNQMISHNAGESVKYTVDILMSGIDGTNENVNRSEDEFAKGDLSNGGANVSHSVYYYEEKKTMPARSVNGNNYIAVIYMPTLGIRLPVMENFSYGKLKNAPCRYQGSLYNDDLVICAHNYTTHFGRLDRLKQNDKIYVYDMAGNEFIFRVTETETLSQYNTEKMVTGDWALTLFTCTLGGTRRITVRCERCS